MSTLTLAEARAVISTSLSDPDLQAIIDREEAWLARRIGPLEDERTETFYAPRGGDVLRLRRPTDTVEVADNAEDVTADVVLRHNGWRIARLLGGWLGPLAVTYTPNDLLEVKRVVVELVRLALAQAATPAGSMLYESETIGDYSYRLGSGTHTAFSIRRALLQSLEPTGEAESVHILGSLEVNPRVTVVT